jgi:hypothetical protein
MMGNLEKSFGNLKSQFAKVGESLATPMGVATLAVGAFAAVAAVGVKGAETLRSAHEELAAKTGETGAALDGLGNTFKTVFKSVPVSDAKDLSDTIAMITKRTGETGAPLAGLTTSFEQLGIVFKTSASGLADSATQAFSKWKVSTGDQGAALTTLMKVSQQTQVPIGELTSKVTAMQPQLSAMGYGFTQSAEMMAQMSAKGIDSSKVVGQMSIGFTKLAKDPKEAQKALKDLGLSSTDMAKAMKDPKVAMGDLLTAVTNAKNPTDALTIASQLFAGRGATAIVQACRSGALSVGALNDKVKSSKETISGAAQASETMGQKYEVVGQKLSMALAPLGELILKLATGLIPVISAVADAIGWFASNWGDKWAAIKGFFVGIWDDIKGAFETAWAALSGAMITAWNAISQPFITAFNAIKDAFTTTWTDIKAAFNTAWGALKTAFDDVISFITSIPGKILSAVGDLGHLLYDKGKDVILGLYNGIKGLWEAEVRGWLNIGGKIKAAVGDLGHLLYDKGKDVILGLYNGIKGLWEAEVRGWLNIGGKIKAAVGDLGSLLYNAGKQVIMGLVHGIEGAIGSVGSAMSKVGHAITGFLHFSEGPLYPVGQQLMQGLANGITSKLGTVTAAMAGVAAAVSGITGIGGQKSAADVGLAASGAANDAKALAAAKAQITADAKAKTDAINVEVAARNAANKAEIAQIKTSGGLSKAASAAKIAAINAEVAAANAASTLEIKNITATRDAALKANADAITANNDAVAAATSAADDLASKYDEVKSQVLAACQAQADAAANSTTLTDQQKQEAADYYTNLESDSNVAYEALQLMQSSYSGDHLKMLTAMSKADQDYANATTSQMTSVTNALKSQAVTTLGVIATVSSAAKAATTAVAAVTTAAVSATADQLAQFKAATGIDASGGDALNQAYLAALAASDYATAAAIAHGGGATTVGAAGSVTVGSGDNAVAYMPGGVGAAQSANPVNIGQGAKNPNAPAPVVNNFSLTVNSSATTEPIIADFNMLKSLAVRAT